MNIKLLLTCCIASFAFFLSTEAQTINYKTNMSGYRFYQGNKVMKMNEAIEAVRSNPAAYELLQIGKNNDICASVLGGIGGFCVGYFLGGKITGGSPDKRIGYFGGGLIIVSFFPTSKAKNKIRQALNLYNEGLSSSSIQNNWHFSMGGTNNGLGLSLSF